MLPYTLYRTGKPAEIALLPGSAFLLILLYTSGHLEPARLMPTTQAEEPCWTVSILLDAVPT